MKINFFSDVHLEFGWLEFPLTDADIIVAAGDIGVGTEAVPWLARASQPVIYIAGNHEFYGGDINHTRDELRAACAGTGVRFLECEQFTYANVRFLAATLWTDFAGGNIDMLRKAATHMNDYQQIRAGERMLNPHDIYAINTNSTAWLRARLAEEFDGKTVVVTHHAPSPQSWNPPPQDPTFVASYCNDLEDLIAASNATLWIHGHIHQCADYMLGNTRVVCNPRGYHGYQSISGFVESAVIEI